MHKKHLSIILSFLFSFSIFAERVIDHQIIDELYAISFEELLNVEIITATGTPKQIHIAPAIATVITASDIEDLGATTLDEILETVPGLHVSPSNESTMDSVFSIRGIHTALNPQVLLLVNGLPFTFAYTGGRITLFMMPVANISRIEIVRGPGSAVHGADAFAGTINIVTKDASEIIGTKTGMRYGSFETYDLWIQHGGQYKGFDVALSLEYFKSDGDKDRIIDSDLQTMLDAMFGTNASLAPGPLISNAEQWDGHLSLSKGNWTLRAWGGLMPVGYQGGDGVTQTLPLNSENEGEHFLGDIEYKNADLINDTELDFRFSYLYIKRDSLVELFPANSILPIGADGNLFTGANIVIFSEGVFGKPVQIDNQTSIDLTTLYKGFAGHTWRFGVGYKDITGEFEESKNFGPGVLLKPYTGMIVDGTLTDVTGTPYIYMPDKTRRVGYLSIQDEFEIDENLEFTAGVRYDHYSDFGETLNPRAALVWKTGEKLITKLLYGTAFRPPSFLELYNQNNPSNVGNGDLDPETIETLELAFDFHPTDNSHFLLSSFIYEIEDIIDLVSLPGQVSTNQNVRDQKGYGFELDATLEVTDSLRVNSNFAYQHSKDKDTDEIVPDAPELQFYANAHWKFISNWSYDVQYYWIGKRHRAATDIRSDIKDNDWVNITLRRKNIAENFDFAVSVRNVFDEDMREPSQATIPNDYPMDSRSVWSEIRWHY